MDGKIASARKEVLVELVKMAQKKGMKGSVGTWKEFLSVFDKKFGSSLSDPTRRSTDALAAFLNTFSQKDDLKFFDKVMRCHSNRNAVEQFKEKSKEVESPEQSERCATAFWEDFRHFNGQISSDIAEGGGGESSGMNEDCPSVVVFKRRMFLPYETRLKPQGPRCVTETPCLDASLGVSLNYAFENTGGGRRSRLIYLGACEGHLIEILISGQVRVDKATLQVLGSDLGVVVLWDLQSEGMPRRAASKRSSVWSMLGLCCGTLVATQVSPEGPTPIHVQRLVRLTLEHPQHPLDYSFPSFEEGWLVTKLSKKNKTMRSTSLIAIDCEMVLCEDGTEAFGDVYILDGVFQVKLNELVNPNKAVADYRSEITGLTAKDLDGVTYSVADIQAVLGYEVRKKGAPHNCLDDAKLVLAKIDGCDNAIYRWFMRMCRRLNDQNCFSMAYPPICPVKNYIKLFLGTSQLKSKDTSGRPQKCISFQLDSGMTGSLYVRKMACDDVIGEVSSMKRSFQDEETTGESKRLKSEQGVGEQTKGGSDLCDGHLERD
ncbi:small RNA degrading nuclease 2 [Actinidia rufa]|uniref:Small RNA degrading nuclease 2 n=1 Tax=Actinidia rufa TaxID=165716 RepID=A0A7J0EJD7_9ERIC|nr:small RNA degrading nuclease 2 [Actinidia rufa]